MSLMVGILLLSVLGFQWVCGNILKNPGFELPSLSGEWTGNGGSIELVNDDYSSGRQALKAYNRGAINEGASQHVTLKPGGRYLFKAHVKQLNDWPGILYQKYETYFQVSWSNDSLPRSDILVVSHPRVQSQTGWFVLEGDVLVPSDDIKSAMVYIGGPDVGINFLIDDAFVEEIWKVESNKLIDKVRKNKIHFSITHDENLNAADLEMEISHKKHLFGFGCRVNEEWITDHSYREYQAIFYHLFNWGTIAGFAWPSPLTANNDHNQQKMAAEMLKKQGLKVRAGSLLVDPSGQIPSWLQHMDAPTFNQTIMDRMENLTNAMAGLVDQWDVLTYILVDQFYVKTGDSSYTETIYTMMNKTDPSIQLLLVASDVLLKGFRTSSFEEEALKLKTYGLSGIGSTYNISSDVDPSILKMRVDTLGAAGLPIWITEFEISSEDENIRADRLEKALRTFFAHENVDGISFTEFWDHENAPNNALLEGFDFQINAAGRRYLDLIKDEWSTYIVRNISYGTSFNVNGFQGDYDVTIYYKSKPIMRREMHLGKSDMVYEMHITGNGDEISLPTTTNPFNYVTHDYHVSTEGDHVISTAYSTASNVNLTCETRWSRITAVGENKTVDISCKPDEVLTGCSSSKQNFKAPDLWQRYGEVLTLTGKNVACRAINGHLPKPGVYAMIRCCRAKDLKCEYRVGGDSEEFWDSVVETKCSDNYLVTGCSGHHYTSGLHGAYPTKDGRRCWAENGASDYGVRSSAACCSAPGLTCTTVESISSDLQKGAKVATKCDIDAGYVMTGCNFHGGDGKSAGAYIAGKGKMQKCIAVNGEMRSPGQEGVRAVAVCCKINQPIPMVG